ncbi:AAA family ATPase, partial [Thermoflexus hugenholtzii]
MAEAHPADLLRPQGVTASERAGKAWEQLREAWLEELRGKFGEPPEAFVRALRGGWQPPGADKPASWPDWVAAYFAHEIKHNQEVAHILHAQLLAGLEAEQRSLSEALRDYLEHLEQRFADFLRRLEDIRQQVEELARQQREGFEELRRGHEEIVALLLTLQETQQAIQGAIEALRSAIERWIGWVAKQYGESHVAAALDRATRKFLEARWEEGFAGRAEALARLNDFVERERSGVVVVYAPAGYGKTAFLAHWIRQVEGPGVGGAVVRVVHHFFDPAHPAAHLARQPSYAYAYLLAQLYRLADRPDPIPSGEDERWAALYGFFADWRAPEGEKWVIVLDGLDNAEGEVRRFVPEELPDGLFVVVSGRWDGAGEEPSYLKEWAVSARRICLEALSEEEVREWLRGAGDRALAPLAENQALIRMLREKTEGFPLFLRYLLDDLAQAVREGKSPEEVLRKTPKGFSAYVSEQLKDLARRLRDGGGFRNLFALLTVARGPLRRDEVEALTGLYAMDLEAIPHQVARWLAIGRTDPPEEQPTYAFAHPLLAEEFRRQLGREAEEMEERLLGWCEGWRQRPSPYILRYYADHLYARWQKAASRSEDPFRDPEARSLYSRMYELALDGEFARVQARRLPEEPHLPLVAVQRALDAAVRWEDAPAMARLLLEHARRAQRGRGTPLEAWRQGHREGALRMMGIALERDHRLGTLWGLLLAWAAEREGEREWARRCLEEVRKRSEGMKGMALQGWQEKVAAFLLAELMQVEGAIEVAGVVLDDSG